MALSPKIGWILLLGWTIGYASAQPQIRVNLEDGAIVRGTVKVIATVQSEDLVQRVEFAIDGILREVDESTPYEFEWDTIADAEGEHVLKITALLEGGKSVVEQRRVTINNEVDKGAEYHYQQARELFAEGKIAQAVDHARIALKAESAHQPARILLTQAYLQVGRLEDAEEESADLVRLFPDSVEAQSLRVITTLRMARRARNERELITKAIEARHQVNALRLQSLRESNEPAAIAQRALLQIREGKASEAIAPLLELNQREDRNPRYLNLLAYAYLNAGRWRDVLVTTETAIRRNIADDYTYALRGLVAGLLNDERTSESAFAQAEKIDKNSRPLMVARAVLAMADRRVVSVGRLAAQAQGVLDDSAEVAFMRYWSFSLNREFDRARDAFWRTLDLEALTPEAYTLRGLLNLADGLRPGEENLLQVAREWFQIALQARENYAPAQLGVALSYAFEIFVAQRDGEKPAPELAQNANEALTKALALTRDTSWMQAGASFVLEQLGRTREADQAIQRALQIDPRRVPTGRPPDPPRLLEILQALMFVPLMHAP